MNRSKILLIVRIILFVALGVWFILRGLEMELPLMKALFVGIGIADFLYAAFLSYPFWRK